jgi:hypothetical protein
MIKLHHVAKRDSCRKEPSVVGFEGPFEDILRWLFRCIVRDHQDELNLIIRKARPHPVIKAQVQISNPLYKNFLIKVGLYGFRKLIQEQDALTLRKIIAVLAVGVDCRS